MWKRRATTIRRIYNGENGFRSKVYQGACVMNKVHDSKILSYQINFETLKIEMTIDTETGQQAKIVFHDICIYYFKDQLPGSILLDLVEEDINQFAHENKKVLETGKDYYWPIDYNQEEELIHYLQNNDYRYYKIQSSYGLNGWVLSKSVSIT